MHGVAAKISSILKQSSSQCTGKHKGGQIKKAWQSKSKLKVMLIVCYDDNGIIMENMMEVPDGVTANQPYYK